MSEIYSTNALDPAERISYAEGTIVAADHIENTLDVSVSGSVYKNLPAAYTSSQVLPESYAFAVNDKVVVRLYNGTPTHITGFKNKLWPFIPMPAETWESESAVMSKSLIQPTSFIRTDKTAFKSAYEQISLKSCDIGFTSYINQPTPDMSGRLVSIQEHKTSNVYSRLSRFYYNGGFIYETYNEETFSNVFNGTRSNIIGAYKDPVSNAGFVLYQVNKFTNWKARTSGRVDFSFHIYSSLGLHKIIAEGYSIVTGPTSAAAGNCIRYYPFGGYSEDSAESGIFISGFYTGPISSFSAAADSNMVNSYEYEKYHRFVQLWSTHGSQISETEYKSNYQGYIELRKGHYYEPSAGIYRKKQ